MRDAKRQWCSLLALASLSAALFSLAPVAHSQTMTTGDIVGSVTDATGAVVPTAKVTVRFVDTNDVRSAVTDANGQYRFSLMRPGDYLVSGEATGLKSK